MAGLVRRAVRLLAPARRHRAGRRAGRRSRRCGDRRDRGRGGPIAGTPSVPPGGTLGRGRPAPAPSRGPGLRPCAGRLDRAQARHVPHRAVSRRRAARRRSRPSRLGNADRLARPQQAGGRHGSRGRRGARPRASSRRELGGAPRVNVWLWGATALLVGLVPCGWIAMRETRMDALAALELAGTVTTLVLVLLPPGFHRRSYYNSPGAARA